MSAAAPKRRAGGRPFVKGHDPRRKVFTAEEQRENFYLMLASEAQKNPGKPLWNILRNLKARRARG